MLGFGTLVSPGAGACGSTVNFTCPEKGGLYINLGADVIFHRRMGFGFDVAWRASQGAYGGDGGQRLPTMASASGFSLRRTASARAPWSGAMKERPM